MKYLVTDMDIDYKIADQVENIRRRGLDDLALIRAAARAYQAYRDAIEWRVAGIESYYIMKEAYKIVCVERKVLEEQQER